MFFKKFQIPFDIVPVSIMDFSFNFPFFHSFHACVSRPIYDVITLNWIIDIIEWTFEEIMLHQTIVISPVQNWALIDSWKVRPVHNLAI